MNISKQLFDEIVAHAVENPTIECCGVVAVERGPDGTATATRVYRTENIHASPLKFEIEPMELYRVNLDIEGHDWEMGAIYHSHVRSPPEPSQTDVSFGQHMGKVEWIIVGLAAGSEPEVRSYLIDSGSIEEVPIAPDGG